MIAKKLIDSWTLPDRSSERVQTTIRLPFTDYARLKALKTLYPDRTVNELMTDIFKAALDEIVDALPSWRATREDVEEDYQNKGDGLPASFYLDEGDEIGPAIRFRLAYAQVLRKLEADSKAVSETEEAS